MITITKTLLNLDEFLKKNNIEYIIIGGTAAVMYGRLRATEDIDVTLMIEFEIMESVHSVLIQKYSPVFENSKDFFTKILFCQLLIQKAKLGLILRLV